MLKLKLKCLLPILAIGIISVSCNKDDDSDSDTPLSFVVDGKEITAPYASWASSGNYLNIGFYSEQTNNTSETIIFNLGMSDKGLTGEQTIDYRTINSLDMTWYNENGDVYRSFEGCGTIDIIENKEDENGFLETFAATFEVKLAHDKDTIQLTNGKINYSDK